MGESLQQFLSFSDKIALVTGGGRGIGRGIAEVLMRQGATVYVNDLALPESTCAELSRIGTTGVCYPVAADVSKREQVQRMVDRIIKEKGKLDFLVNNAGITSRVSLLEIDDEHWQKVMDTNLRGTFLCTQIAARHMVKRKFGRIINVSSAAAWCARVNRGVYAAAKAGIIAVTKVWAGELAPYGVTVNAYAPGDILTEMIADIRGAEEEVLLDRIALRRFGTPEDIGRLVAFLVSPMADYLTGVTIEVTGGKLIVQNPGDAWKNIS